MSDTATEAAAKRFQKPRDVNYTLEIVDDLPESELARRSPLEDQIATIVSTEDAHNRFVRIASYANGSAASAAGNQLRKRHGDTEAVDGFTIRTKREAAENGAPHRTGLFVRFNPSAIVPGGREDFEKRTKAREARNVERREAREAEAADAATKGKTNKSKTPA